VSSATRSAIKLALFSALAWAGACSYPDYGFSDGASGSGGQAGSGAFGGNAGLGGSAGGEVDAADASDGMKSDAPDVSGGCKPGDELELGKAVSGTNDPLNASNISKAINDYSCGNKACDGFEATWRFTPAAVATYRFTLTSLSADCDLYIVGPGVCGGICASPTSSSTQKVGTTETVDVGLVTGMTYFASVDAAPSVFCTFQLAVIQL
jgi:hypothetical protein